MRLLIPKFLKKIDLYLLTHYPNFWATRAHYFVFYSFICGNLLMFLLGILCSISKANIPGYETIVLMTDLLRLFASLDHYLLGL